MNMKMNRLKKCLILVLVFAMIGTLVACDGSTTTAPTTASTTTKESKETETSQSSTEPAFSYYGNDVSEPVDLVLYYVGDKYGDEEMIFEAINEVIKEKVNATITFKALSMSDYATNYSLLLAGGEPIDLIYTSAWCFYNEEAGKGAFLEITEEMLKQYMPQTYETQDKATFEQGKIDGVLYYVPCYKVGYGSACTVIRGDLREKYNMEPLKSLDDFFSYLSAVAADKESGVAYAYNASMNGELLQSMICVAPNSLITLQDKFFYYRYSENPTADDIVFLYETPEFKDFAVKMQQCAKEGCWSMSAINNQTSVQDSFLNGTSAVFIQNLGTCGNVANSVLQSNPDWKPEIYWLPEDGVTIKQFDKDGYAVPYTSQHPERALMALDVLKNDPKAYITARYGIEGYHIKINSDGTWSKAEHYGTWSYGAAVSWGLKNSNLEMIQEGTFPDELEILEKMKQVAIYSPTSGFSFSTTAIADSWANLNEAYTTYVPLLQLGLVDDIDSWLSEFLNAAESAGLEAIKTEVKRQFTAYMESH